MASTSSPTEDHRLTHAAHIDQFTVRAADEAYTCFVPNPWPTQLNPSYTPEAEHDCDAHWAESRGLRYPSLNQFKSMLLAAYTLPRVSLDALRVAGRLNTFLFAHDDLYVDVEEPSLDAVRQLNGAYEQVLATEPDPADCDVHLAAMLADIVRGLRAFNVDPEPVKHSLLTYLAESVRELERRERGLKTDLAEYLAHRPASGGVFIEFELSYLLNGFSLPRWLRDAEAFQRARQAAAIHICMANDCLSLPKELDSGDTHNVVRILRESEGRDSYQDCVSQVYDRFLLPSVREVVGNARKLALEHPADQRAVCAAIQALTDWAGGHICWEKTSARHEHLQHY